MIIDLIKDETWKITLEKNKEDKYRFIINHGDSIEITTKYLVFDKDELLISRKVLREVSKEIDKGKLNSKYDSFVLLEDIKGQFLVSIELMEYHNFVLNFINYSADFSLKLIGHAFEIGELRNALDLL